MRDYPDKPKPTFPNAVFLDRDGTINVDTHYPHKIEELQLIPEAAQGLKMLSELPCPLIVISNQSGIALDLFTQADMTAFNRELLRRLAPARLDAIYFCPHAENSGHDNEHCTCSKPLPGLLFEAAEEYEIDLAGSFMIGDKTSDILAGQRAGCRTILVKTGKGGKEEGAFDVQPDYVAEHLLDAALIVKAYFS